MIDTEVASGSKKGGALENCTTQWKTRAIMFKLHVVDTFFATISNSLDRIQGESKNIYILKLTVPFFHPQQYLTRKKTLPPIQ